jgi:hypothetical protein
MRFEVRATWAIAALVAFAFFVSSGAAVAANSTSEPSPAPAPTAAASPVPTPTASPVSVGKVNFNAVATASRIFTDGINAGGSLDTASGADLATRSNVSNLLVLIAKPNGAFRFGTMVGLYSIPVVGFGGNKTADPNANTGLYGPVPLAFVEYAPSGALNVTVGKLATLIGNESTYTYQNTNIQRGVVWNMETALSRGARITTVQGPLTASLGVNDGFYSGRYLGFEGSLGVAPTPSFGYAFNFAIPNRSAPPNPTASVANRRLYNPSLSLTFGKWQLQPNVLFVDSPASSALGYTRDEQAFGAVLPASVSLGSVWSAGFRVEYGKNGSNPSDPSPNANLLGYGPGSSAWTYTLTPAYKNKALLARAEFSQVSVANFTPGVAFGTAGTRSNQSRFGIELGYQY